MPPEWIAFVFSRYGAAVGIAAVAVCVAGWALWQLNAMRLTLKHHTETDDLIVDGIHKTLIEIRDALREDREERRAETDHARASRGRIHENQREIGNRLARLEGQLSPPKKRS